MRRSLLCAAFLALVFAPAALADGGPSPGVRYGEDGIASPNGRIHYVTLPAGSQTALATIRRDGGRVTRFTTLTGQWGVPLVAFDGTTSGLSRDGRTLILEAARQSPDLRTYSSFMLVDARNLRARDVVGIKGDFSFDALSPNGKTLYLIQHIDARNATRYVVRSYDLEHGKLNAGRIADKSQPDWVMAGWPLSRAASADGRWVYTLYRRGGGYPFVHVLDAVNRKAHCVGIPWTGNQDGLWRMKLAARPGGLAINRPNGELFATIDLATYTFTRAETQQGAFPWWIVVVVALAVATPGSLLGRSLKRRRSTAARA